jgi:hypothetical protein
MACLLKEPGSMLGVRGQMYPTVIEGSLSVADHMMGFVHEAAVRIYSDDGVRNGSSTLLLMTSTDVLDSTIPMYTNSRKTVPKALLKNVVQTVYRDVKFTKNWQ